MDRVDSVSESEIEHILGIGEQVGLHNTQSTQKHARPGEKQARLEEKEKSPYSARAFLSAHANWSGQDVGLGPH